MKVCHLSNHIISGAVSTIPVFILKLSQANSILDCTHQVIGNLLHSSCLITQDLCTVATQQELLMPVMWAINTTFHTTLKASPGQLAFNCNMILPTSFAANRYAINSCKQAQSQSATNAKNHKSIPHEFCLNNKVLICHDTGNPYLGKLPKPTQGPYKIIDVQQLPINGTILIQWSLTSVECINIRQLLPFFECYNWGCKCHTSVIMTLWPTHTLVHDITTKYPKPAELTKWLVLKNCKSDSLSKTFDLQPSFSQNTSHSHDNLRRVSKSPLLHPFTHRRSDTLDWQIQVD